MTSDESIEQVTETLTICADTLGDIVPPVFERFFELNEEAALLMRHSDVHMQGRMMEAVLDLMLSDEHFGPNGYLEWELDNHIDAYAASAEMYEAFFVALLEVVRNGVNSWQPRHQQAWQLRVERVMQQVRAH